MKNRSKSRRLCRLSTEIYIYIMLAVYPLFVGFWGYTRLTDSKFVFFAAVTVLWLLSLLSFQCIFGFLSLRRKTNAVSLLLAAFLLVCGISSLLSPYGTDVILGAGRYDGLLTAALCLCIFFGVSLYGRPRRRYVLALASAAGLNCVIAVMQLFGLNALELFPSQYTYYDGGVKYSGEFLGLIGNADLFSVYLCMALTASTAVYIASARRIIALLPCSALMCFCLFACSVSGGKLAFIVAVLLGTPFLIMDGGALRRALEVWVLLLLSTALSLAFNVEKAGETVSVSLLLSPAVLTLIVLAIVAAAVRQLVRRREFKPRTLTRFFGTVSVAAIIGALAAVYLIDFSSGTLHELHNVLHGHIEDSYGSSRILIWRETLGLIGERPLLGGGPGTLANRLDIDFSRFVAETGKTLKTGVDNAHCVYLGIAADTGLVSLALYLSAQIMTAVRVLRRRKAAVLPLCLLCGLAACWTSDIFGLGLFIVSPLMWVLWGLAASDNKR